MSLCSCLEKWACILHRLKTIQIEFSSFQDLGVFVHNNPQTEAQRTFTRIPLCITRQRERMRVIHLGLCLRDIVNEKPINLEKTTSSVLSVLLLLYVTNNQRLFRKLVIFKVFFQFNMHSIPQG